MLFFEREKKRESVCRYGEGDEGKGLVGERRIKEGQRETSRERERERKREGKGSPLSKRVKETELACVIGTFVARLTFCVSDDTVFRASPPCVREPK